MDETRTKRLIYRWSFMTAILIALFWAIWYHITGYIPVVEGIKITNNWTIQLPFKMSRLYDILIGPIWVTTFFCIWHKVSKENMETDDLGISLAIGLGYGLVVGLVFGLGFGLIILFRIAIAQR